MSKDKKPQQRQDTTKVSPIREGWNSSKGDRANDDSKKRINEVTQRPTTKPDEKND
jgi:hypothetical protein